MSGWRSRRSTGRASMSRSATNGACRRTIPAATTIWRRPRCSTASRSRPGTCCACAAKTRPKRRRRATPMTFATPWARTGGSISSCSASATTGIPRRSFRAWPRSTRRARTVVACYVEVVGMWRLTLTPPPINAARRVAFLASGEGKAEVLHRVLQGPRKPVELPAQAIRPIGAARRLADRRGGRGEAGAMNLKRGRPIAGSPRSGNCFHWCGASRALLMIGESSDLIFRYWKSELMVI